MRYIGRKTERYYISLIGQPGGEYTLMVSDQWMRSAPDGYFKGSLVQLIGALNNHLRNYRRVCALGLGIEKAFCDALEKSYGFHVEYL